MPKTSALHYGDVVYLRADSDEAGVITGVIQRGIATTYLITWHDRTESEHQAIELTSEKSF